MEALANAKMPPPCRNAKQAKMTPKLSTRATNATRALEDARPSGKRSTARADASCRCVSGAMAGWCALRPKGRSVEDVESALLP